MFSLFGSQQCNEDEVLKLIRLDDRAFEQAYKCIKKLYFPKVKGFLKKKGIYSEEDQSDLITDAILIFRKKVIMGDFEKRDAKISTYLIALIKNKIKEKSRNPGLNIEYQEVIEAPDTIEDSKNHDYLPSKMSKALQELSAFCQELLRSIFIYEKNCEQFAGQKGMKAANVRQHKRRCLKKLRKIYKS